MFVFVAAGAQVIEEMRRALTRVNDIKRLQTEYLAQVHGEIGPRPDGRLCSLTADFENLEGAGQGVDEVIRKLGLVGKVGAGGSPLSGNLADPV